MAEYQDDLSQAFRAIKALILRNWPDHPPLTDADNATDEAFDGYLNQHDPRRRDEFRNMLNDWITKNFNSYDKSGKRLR